MIVLLPPALLVFLLFSAAVLLLLILLLLLQGNFTPSSWKVLGDAPCWLSYKWVTGT